MQEELFQEAKKHFNEPILIGFTLCRCIGYAEDDDDCYLIVKSRERGVFWHTFVGGYVYLGILKTQGGIKASHSDEILTDYFRLDEILKLNGVPKEKEFLFWEWHCETPVKNEISTIQLTPENAL
jgi:hypothetical protein